ncbi:hypothetical protein [Anaerobutyricum hallii]|jgi:hypothetical protein
MEADYSSKLISDSENLPDDGKRKKPLHNKHIQITYGTEILNKKWR